MIANIPEGARALLWILGAMKQLEDWGLISGGHGHGITHKGLAAWDQLDAAWQPDNQALMNMCELHDWPIGAYLLLQAFRDRRDEMWQRVETALDSGGED